MKDGFVGGFRNCLTELVGDRWEGTAKLLLASPYKSPLQPLVNDQSYISLSCHSLPQGPCFATYSNLGLTGYLKQYVPYYTAIAKPLQERKTYLY